MAQLCYSVLKPAGCTFKWRISSSFSGSWGGEGFSFMHQISELTRMCIRPSSWQTQGQGYTRRLSLVLLHPACQLLFRLFLNNDVILFWKNSISMFRSSPNNKWQVCRQEGCTMKWLRQVQLCTPSSWSSPFPPLLLGRLKDPDFPIIHREMNPKDKVQGLEGTTIAI